VQNLEALYVTHSGHVLHGCAATYAEVNKNVIMEAVTSGSPSHELQLISIQLRQSVC
jgi:hypothetical protein